MSKDFTPYIFSKREIYRIFEYADWIGPNKNKFVNTSHVYSAILRTLYACGTRIGETVRLKTEDVNLDEGLDPYCSLPALSTYMGHKGSESTEYYLRLTKHYFITVLHYTQAQADIIFPEVES